MLEALGGISARGNEVKSILAALCLILVALGSLLGRSWPFLFVLESLLGGLGSLLGRPGAVLGRSWGGLGASWGGFGAAGEAENIDFPLVFQ